MGRTAPDRATPHARQCVGRGEASLRRLGLERIDLYQIHWPNPDADIEEAWDAMATLRQQGKVAAYRAAPKLFMKREFMQVLREMLPKRRKYVFVGVNPDRVNVKVDLQEPAPLFSPSDLTGESGQ